jgi:hypothetical protein
MGSRVADDDGAGNDYTGIPYFLKIFIMNFRLAVGDLIVPDLGIWTNNLVTCLEKDDPDYDETKLCAKDGSTGAAISIIWFFWILNVLIMVIILLNFLIAEIS